MPTPFQKKGRQHNDRNLAPVPPSSSSPDTQHKATAEPDHALPKAFMVLPLALCVPQQSEMIKE
jgi:hypothetical protein